MATAKLRLGSLGLVLLLGCGSGPDDERVFGTFRLVGVEGQTLPYLVPDPNCDVFIAQGELILRESGTYNLEFSGPFDCSRSGGPSGENMGRFYTGTFSQDQGELTFQAVLPGETLEFTGTVNPLESFVTVPPIPPTTGPDLTLQFAIEQ